MLGWLAILLLGLLAILFFWPGIGLARRWRQVHELSARVLREDALKHVDQAQVNGRRPTLQSIAGTLAGAIIWLMANIRTGGLSIAEHLLRDGCRGEQ